MGPSGKCTSPLITLTPSDACDAMLASASRPKRYFFTAISLHSAGMTASKRSQFRPSAYPGDTYPARIVHRAHPTALLAAQNCSMWVKTMLTMHSLDKWREGIGNRYC